MAVFLLQHTDTKPVGVHNPLSPDDKEQVNRNIQDTIEREKTPTAISGDKIGDTDPALQNAKKVSPAPKTKSGKLTYHAELLQTNPVKALRLQTEELGSWAAAWIPPFPPDDTEAQEFARVRYLMKYYFHNLGI